MTEEINIYAMKLHDWEVSGKFEVLRVHGGWIYTIYAKECTSVFVPFSEEIHSKSNPAEIIKAVPYQVCPFCEGFGKIQNDNLNAVGLLYVDCPVCSGSRVIQMYAMLNEEFNKEE